MKKGKLAMVPPRPATKVTPGRIGKKGILTQLDQDTALQALGEEAFNELLQRYDR